jgi:predicted transcriptional regulator YdeE
MKIQNKEMESAIIVGISTRTTNANGQSSIDIGKLWTRFFDEKISDKIQNKISDDIYCLYTDYNTINDDYNQGDYLCLIGVKVSDNFDTKLLEIEKLEKFNINRDYYKEFEAHGKLPDCVANTWIHIWSEKYQRAYNVDFDLYPSDKFNYENATVLTYLSIKNQ